MEEKIFVLYSKNTRASAKALAENLANTRGILSKYKIVHGTSNELRAHKGIKLVLNVGTRDAIPCDTIINRPEFVRKSADKRAARILFKDKNVPAPELWLDHKKIPSEAYPVVGRTTSHTKGHGFWLCKGPKGAAKAASEGATHFIKFIPNTREFRVHIIATREGNHSAEDYSSVKVSEKTFSGNKAPGYDTIKNRENGWVFSSPSSELGRDFMASLRDISKKAVSAVGLDWGAVDIMYSNDTKKFYVLEINSNPRLTDDNANTLEKYSEWLSRLCKEMLDSRCEKARSKKDIENITNLLGRLRFNKSTARKRTVSR